MPDPYVSDLPERPDPEVLLIDAVISRQDDLAARLAQQWVHRRGWSDLDAFIDAGLLRTCGPEGVAWLRQQMRHNPGDRPAAEPRPSLGTLFQQAFDEALAPIRPDSHDDATPSSDPWGSHRSCSNRRVNRCWPKCPRPALPTWPSCDPGSTATPPEMGTPLIASGLIVSVQAPEGSPASSRCDRGHG